MQLLQLYYHQSTAEITISLHTVMKLFYCKQNQSLYDQETRTYTLFQRATHVETAVLRNQFVLQIRGRQKKKAWSVTKPAKPTQKVIRKKADLISHMKSANILVLLNNSH